MNEAAASRLRLWPLAWPIFLELCLAIAVGMAGTLLAARVSDAAGAAFAMTQHLMSMLFILFRILGAGIGVVVAQSLGRGRRDAADRVAKATLGASTWLGLSTALFAAAAAHPLLGLLQAPDSIRPIAAALLLALAPSLALDAWIVAMTGVLRAHLRARDTLGVIVVMQVLHLALAAWLMPRLGLAGFAWALAASRLLGLGCLWALWHRRLGLRPTLSDAWRLQPDELSAVLRIGLPGAAENIAYRLAFLASVAVVGTMGPAAVATHAYAQQIGFVPMLAGVAIGLAVEIVVGHRVGAGQLHVADRLVRRALGLGLMVGLAVAGVVAALAEPLLRRFTGDPAIVSLGATLLLWGVVLEPGRTFNVIVINALRAAGDARYPVQVGVFSMIGVLAGGSWLLGSVLELGLVGVWIAYAADEWVRGLLMWRRWVRLRWVPHARAVHHRLRRAAPQPVNARAAAERRPRR